MQLIFRASRPRELWTSNVNSRIRGSRTLSEGRYPCAGPRVTCIYTSISHSAWILNLCGRPMQLPICAWRRRVQYEVGTLHCFVYESSYWMGRIDHDCIRPFKGTYSPLWEYGARKARLALKRAVVGVLSRLPVPHQILCTYTHWRKLCTLHSHLRLVDRMAYCHDYLHQLRSSIEVADCGFPSWRQLLDVSQGITT